MKDTILLIDDNTNATANLKDIFCCDSFNCLYSNNLNDIKNYLSQKNILLVIIKDTLYKTNILSKNHNENVVAFGESENSQDICEAFDKGATDYISLSSNNLIIKARIASILKRLT